MEQQENFAVFLNPLLIHKVNSECKIMNSIFSNSNSRHKSKFRKKNLLNTSLQTLQRTHNIAMKSAIFSKIQNERDNLNKCET